MFDFVRSLFRTTRIVHKTIQVVREDKASEKNWSALPMREFLPAWAEAMTFPAAGMRSSLKAAASPQDVAQAETRLGLSLPEELRALYLCSNGIDREIRDAGEPARNVLAVQALVKPSARAPGLSALLRDEWRANGRDDGEPEGLCVFSTGFKSLLPDGYEFVLAFEDVDGMLSLESAGLGPMAVLVVTPDAYFAVGTILQIENGTATRYDGIRQWLASGMSMAIRHKEMFGRYSKAAG